MAMHLCRRFQVMLLGLADRSERNGVDACANDLGARRLLVGRNDSAFFKLDIACMPGMAWRKDRFHTDPVSGTGRDLAALLRRWQAAFTVRQAKKKPHQSGAPS
ncbi:hypothetical protein [Neoaquamicrobium sediminum]|uniref:hypothetical protein n=1 Tax=Neoaquamicrobium sediminum TaxID=1849104 RepID=UPI0028A7E0A9|nr:hypothetical protein [Mesorhizobium sediminum]